MTYAEVLLSTRPCAGRSCPRPCPLFCVPFSSGQCHITHTTWSTRPPPTRPYARSHSSLPHSLLTKWGPPEGGCRWRGARAGPSLSPRAALSEAAEVYFKAIQKIGEQALRSSTSQILGEAPLLP